MHQRWYLLRPDGIAILCHNCLWPCLYTYMYIDTILGYICKWYTQFCDYQNAQVNDHLPHMHCSCWRSSQTITGSHLCASAFLQHHMVQIDPPMPPSQDHVDVSYSK